MERVETIIEEMIITRVKVTVVSCKSLKFYFKTIEKLF